MPPSYDLRRYLATRRNRNLALARLREHWDEARSMLGSRGYAAERLSEIEIPEDGAVSLYWSYHRDGPVERAPELPARFVAYVLPFLVTADSSKIQSVLETDPLEALQLGTYVGSCLGLGGSFSYSAAAVVLDVNKQVVYARDQNGAIVGRQLLAISTGSTLLCFAVYPASAPEPIRAAFRNYDEQLAERLGIAIHDPTDSEYEVEALISRDWWDDSLWESDEAPRKRSSPSDR
jgi:hypothetical protein